MNKSPFFLIREFMSPLECEDVILGIDETEPNYNIDDKPVKTIMRLPVLQSRLWNRLSEYFDSLEEYYSTEIYTLTPIDFEWYPTNCEEEIPRCENSMYRDNKWAIYNDYDFVVVVFLKNFNNKSDFDEISECYGGQLEITNHNFSFNPERGTAVIFPANQYFINRTKSPTYGDAHQLRFFITCEDRFNYKREDFSGNHTTWFKGLT